MFLYGNSHWRVELKWLTGWSNEVLRAIPCREEGLIYRNAGLVEVRVNGRPALINPEIDGDTNAFLMREGYPPRDANGDPYELHHIGQHPDSPFVELTRQQYMGDGNDAILHPQHENEMDQELFEREKKEYWMARFEDFKDFYFSSKL